MKAILQECNSLENPQTAMWASFNGPLMAIYLCHLSQPEQLQVN